MTLWLLMRSLVGWLFIGIGMKAMHRDDPDMAGLELAVNLARVRLEKKRGLAPSRCPTCLDATCEGERYHDIHGSWGPRDLRRWFVAGAKWWEFTSTGATMWGSDVDKASTEAERRYGNPEAQVPRDRAEPGRRPA